MGKSHYLSRVKELLDGALRCSGNSVVVPIHGPKVTTSSIIDGLWRQKDCEKPMIYHIDISSNVSKLLNGIIIIYYTIFRCCGKWTPFCSVC